MFLALIVSSESAFPEDMVAALQPTTGTVLSTSNT